MTKKRRATDMKPASTEWTYGDDGKAHILVVDDDPRLLSGLASLLRSKGYEVTEAEGGQIGRAHV